MEPEVYLETAAAEAAHFWFRELRWVWTALLDAALGQRSDLRILDAGCGVGGNLVRLEAVHRAVGIDWSEMALSICRPRVRAPLARASVELLPFRTASFDAILSTDVLYHRAVTDDGAALREFARVLKPGGVAILNLPAFESLRSAHDRAVHTARRYTRAGLTAGIRAAGLVPERTIYWNGILLGPSALVRLWRRQAGRHSDIVNPPAVINALLTAVGKLDAALALAGLLPAGLSVAAVARKPMILDARQGA